ncbi:MAG: hypothetical protein JXB34_00420 [Bacteroidales bacterium]|nr:hypothetical protein [Bacteroidales bacterium]
MKQILITGLDGSGKSTLFDALAARKTNNTTGLLRLPHIDIYGIVNDKPLLKAASFVNYINQLSDQQQNTALKAVSLFASMLLYRPIMQNMESQGIEVVIAERHPLIDAEAYAGYYAPKARLPEPGRPQFSPINKQFSCEIAYLTSLIPEEYIKTCPGPLLENLSAFVFTYFFTEKKTGIAALSKLFKIEPPHVIYFLKASPEILMQRLLSRKKHEAHETLLTLTELDQVYLKLAENLKPETSVLFNIIDASSFENLNNFRSQIEKDYFRI